MDYEPDPELLALLPPGFRLPTDEEVLPPHWLEPEPADVAGLTALVDRLLHETVLMVADGRTCPLIGQATYKYANEIVESGILRLLERGWGVHEALRGCARSIHTAKPLPGLVDENPEAGAFLDWCRGQAGACRRPH